MLGILGMFASEVVHKGQVLSETTLFDTLKAGPVV